MDLSRIKIALAKLIQKFSQIKTDKGVFDFDGEDLKEGMRVQIVETDENGEEIKKDAPAGEYTTEDGKVVTIDDNSVVSSIVDPKAEVDGEEEVVGEDTNMAEEDGNEFEARLSALEEKVEALSKIVAELTNKTDETIGSIDEQLSKIVKMSASKPITEQFESHSGDDSINDKKLNHFRELCK